MIATKKKSERACSRNAKTDPRIAERESVVLVEFAKRGQAAMDVRISMLTECPHSARESERGKGQ